MTTPENIIESIKAEIQKSLDTMISSTEKVLRDRSDQANNEMDRLKELAKNHFEEAYKNLSKKDAKKEASNILKQYQDQINQVESETVKNLNESWNTAKTRVNQMIEKVKPALGDFVKIAEDNLKDIQKVIDKEIADCSKKTKDYSKKAKQEMQKNLDQIAKQN